MIVAKASHLATSIGLSYIPTESWNNPRMAPSSVDDGYGGSGPAAPAAKTR